MNGLFSRSTPSSSAMRKFASALKNKFSTQKLVFPKFNTVPVVRKPVVVKPATPKPLVKVPVFKKPVFRKLVFSKPPTSKPAFKKPIVAKPLRRPVIAPKPVVRKPVFKKPVVVNRSTPKLVKMPVFRKPVVPQPIPRTLIRPKPVVRKQVVAKPAPKPIPKPVISMPVVAKQATSQRSEIPTTNVLIPEAPTQAAIGGSSLKNIVIVGAAIATASVLLKGQGAGEKAIKKPAKKKSISGLPTLELV